MSFKHLSLKLSLQEMMLLSILALATVVNFAGALGPELGFDALWYHLTISKIYLLSGQIFHIPGGLLYYSAMPRLVEIVDMPLLQFFSDTGPHFLSFLAGICTTGLTYKIARTKLNRLESLLAATIFYITPIVGWLSGSAYIDLVVTFWSTLAFYFYLKRNNLLLGLSLGLLISTKSLGWGTLGLYFLMLTLLEKRPFEGLRTVLLATLVALPWYVLAFLNTGSPLYPIGAGLLDSHHSSLPQIIHPWSLLVDYWNLFLHPQDIISPVYLLILPLSVPVLKPLWNKHRLFLVFFLLSYFVWWLIPRTGGGRFILPFLPMWSVLVVLVIHLSQKRIQHLLVASIIIVSALNLVYRIGAGYKLINYLLGKESKQAYVCTNLDFSIGNFYDCDSYLSHHLTRHDLVYVAGVHNLYYLNFPFVDESYYRGQKTNYILVQNRDLLPLPFPLNLQNWTLVHHNTLTRSKLYKAQ